MTPDEESECSEDEDFEPIASNLPSSSESSEESSNESSDEDNESHTETANWTGCNDTYWKSDTPLPSRTPRHNIMHEQPSPKQTVITPFNAFKLFLLEEIVKEVCKCTNLEGRKVATSRKKAGNNVSKKELLAYFGFVVLAGSEKQWDVSTPGLGSCSHETIQFWRSWSWSQSQVLILCRARAGAGTIKIFAGSCSIFFTFRSHLINLWIEMYIKVMLWVCLC